MLLFSPSHQPWLAAASVTLALLSPLNVRAAAAPVPTDMANWTCAGNCGGSAADGDIGLSPLGSGRYGFVSTADSAATGVSPLLLPSNSRGDGSQNNGSRLRSAAFDASTGDTLDMVFNYVSTDGKGFDDYAWARVIDASSTSTVAWLFTARSSNSNTRGIVPGDVVDRNDFDPDVRLVDYDNWDFISKTVADPVDWSRLGASNGSCWKDNAAGCGYTGWMASTYAFVTSGRYQLEVGVVNWGDQAFDSGLAFDLAGLSAPAAVPEPASAGLLAGGLALLALAARRRRT